MTKKRWWLVGAAVALVVGPGCGGAVGMDRGPVPPMAEDAPVQIDDQRIAEALSRRPQLPERVRVGVYFREPAEGDWRWTLEDEQRVLDAAEDVERVDLFLISQGFVQSTDLAALRLAAAHHGAHAILVVDGAVEQETSDNGWLVTYPLLLPILFAPAQELDTRFATEAAMHDVRNGYLYLTAESEAMEEQQRAHVWIDREGGVEEARRRAIEHLRDELAARLEHLVSVEAETASASEPEPEPEADEEPEPTPATAPPSATPQDAPEPAPAPAGEPI